jgi:hypothetical protein
VRQGPRPAARNRASGLRAGRKGMVFALSICLGLASISYACAANPPPTERPVAASPTASSSPVNAEPTETVGPTFPYPAAILFFNTSTGDLDLVSQDGISLAHLGSITWTEPDRLKGTTLGDIGAEYGRVRFAYLTTDDDGLELDVRSTIGTISLGEFPMGTLLAGSVPAGMLAVSVPDVVGAGDKEESEIYVVDPVRRTGLEKPVVRGIVPGAVPLMLQVENGQPSAVLYCLSLSDDLITEDDPCHGLYRVELDSGQTDQMAADSLAILALSADARIAAFASDDRIPPDVRVRNLDSAVEVVFRSEPGVREVHEGALSPAGTRLAWVSLSREDGGKDVLAVNLASTSGGPVTLLANTTLSEAVGDEVTDVDPVGWLDEGRLLLEISTIRGPALYVLLLAEGRIDHITPGRMAGFVYR